MADKKDPRKRQLADARKRADEETEQQLERVASARPTPTQEENDRAKLGVESLSELDDKEPDGTAEERTLAAGEAGAYQTRDAGTRRK